MLIDTHCHLDRIDLTPYGGDFAAFMAATRAAGVTQLLCAGITLEDYPQMRALVDPYPEVVVAVGVHPNEHGCREPQSGEIERLAADPRVVAIGETGLDGHHGEIRNQEGRFRQHIAAARACGKPLVVHSRAARSETIRILREEHAHDVGGIMHCFTEDWEMARQALDLGFYLSFSGIVTFKNAAALREVARRAPAERLLIETDAPYLAPVPHRGKPNEPRWLVYVAALLATVRGITPEELGALTSANFARLFAGAGVMPSLRTQA